MSLNINIKKIALVSLIFLLSNDAYSQKNIDPTRQLDPVRSINC